MDRNRTLWIHTKSVRVLLGLIPICLPFLFSIPPFPSWCLINGINYLQLAAWSWQPLTSCVPFVSRSAVTRYAPCGAVAGLMKGNQAGLSPSLFLSCSFLVCVSKEMCVCVCESLPRLSPASGDSKRTPAAQRARPARLVCTDIRTVACLGWNDFRALTKQI